MFACVSFPISSFKYLNNILVYNRNSQLDKTKLPNVNFFFDEENGWLVIKGNDCTRQKPRQPSNMTITNKYT